MFPEFVSTLTAGFRQSGFYAACLGLLTLLTIATAYGASLTEPECLRLGLQRDDYRQLLESRQSLAESELTAYKTWPNPELEITREELDGETETAIWLRQAFDISGRRGISRQSAHASVEAARLAANAGRAERSAAISRQFHQTLYHQRKQALIAHWMERFAAVERSMKHREEAGDVSGYDRLRISRERARLLARQREELVAFDTARWRLQELLGLAASPIDELEGELLPDEPPLLGQVLENVHNQAGLLALRRQSDADQLATEAARRGWIPDLTLGLGHRELDGPQGDESGLSVSAGLSIPLFDRGVAQRQRAEAQWLQSRTEFELAQLRARSEAERLWQQASRQLENARLFKSQSLNDAHELLRIAETAYENNELGVLELIDAYRTALEEDQSALGLALEARLSRIELDSLMAGVTP